MKIPVRNIYFLLTYAWDILKEGEFAEISKEDYETLPELFAKVLESGLTHLLKRGLDRDYITEEEDTDRPRGKIDLVETAKHKWRHQARVHCHVDSLSYDVLHNRIIKSTLRRLLKSPGELEVDVRKRLMRIYRKLHDINEVELSPGIFSRVRLHRNNAYYGFLMHVCSFIYDNLLPDEKAGEYKFRDFLRDDKQMARVFEKFVYHFLKRELSGFEVKGKKTLAWQGIEAAEEDMAYMPRMEMDVVLENDERKIVIDTKYYSNTLQGYYGSEKIQSPNLYQLFAYLKNLNELEEGEKEIQGVLLYPTISKSLDLNYRIQGHRVRVVTVDLGGSVEEIKNTLRALVD